MTYLHKSEASPEKLAWWDAVCRDTTLAMQDHCMRYLSPISVSQSVSDEWGELEGTGAYISYNGLRLLLSNEHVLNKHKALQYGHQFQGCEDVFALTAPPSLEPEPVDAGCAVISDPIWTSRKHTAEAIPQSRVAERHDPQACELFFIAGFPGERSVPLRQALITRATRLITQADPADSGEGLNKGEFRVQYSPERAASVETGAPVTLGDPGGMSGSLVWNTRRVECLANNREWTPELALVTGMLCRWDSGTTSLIATRIEVIRGFLERTFGVWAI